MRQYRTRHSGCLASYPSLGQYQQYPIRPWPVPAGASVSTRRVQSIGRYRTPHSECVARWGAYPQLEAGT
eukprot:574319-Rhodomonas_salina.2